MFSNLKFNRYFQYKFLRNSILSYMGIVITTITAITFFLFYFFSMATTTGINKYSESSLKQISYASDLIYNQVANINNQLETDSYLMNFINIDPSESVQKKVSEYQIFTKLTQIQAVYPFITSISIYRLDNTLSVDTQNIPIDRNVLMEHSKQYLFFYPRSVQTFKITPRKELLTFIFYSNFSRPNSERFAIVVNVNQSYILDTISRINGFKIDSSVLVIDSDGNVLSASNDKLFLKNLSTVGYVKYVLSSHSNEGSTLYKSDGNKYLISYVKSDTINWSIISVSTYSSCIADIIHIRNILLIIVAFISLFVLLLAFLFARIQYNPMQNLLGKIGGQYPSKSTIDEYALLADTFARSIDIQKTAESYLQDTSQFTKRFCLSSLLKGTDKKSFKKEIHKIIQTDFTGPHFCVLLLKIDNFVVIKKSDDISLLYFALQNITLEIFRQKFKADCTETEENEIVFLLQYSDENILPELRSMLPIIHDIMQTNFNLSFSAAIGETALEIDQLHIAYKSAVEFIKYRLFYGHGSIIDNTIVRSHLLEKSKDPSRVSKKLVESLRICNYSNIEKYIKEYMESISKVSYYQAIACCTQIVTEISKNFSDLNPFDEEMKIVNQINNSETVMEISSNIRSFCERICSLIEMKTKQRSDQKNLEIVEKVLDYINDQYQNPNLSLEMISDYIGLTPGYIGKLFKIYKCQSFNEYVTSLRLEKAKILLETTSDTMSSICQAVGIFNVNYFFTLFKKSFAITPSNYRDSFINESQQTESLPPERR